MKIRALMDMRKSALKDEDAVNSFYNKVIESVSDGFVTMLFFWHMTTMTFSRIPPTVKKRIQPMFFHT